MKNLVKEKHLWAKRCWQTSVGKLMNNFQSKLNSQLKNRVCNYQTATDLDFP